MRTTSVYGTVALAALASAGPVSRRDFTFPDDTCGFTEKAELYAEIEAAQEMAEHTAANLPGAYFDTFFPGADAAAISAQYSAIATYLKRNDKSLLFTVSCDDSAPACQAGAYIGATADGVTFCSKYFDGDLVSTEDTEDACATLDIVGASKSRSSHIVSALATVNSDATGIAKGYTDAAKLAAGTFDRSTASYADPANVLCPNEAGAEGLCSPSLAVNNADSWALTADGISYSIVCRRQIPLPTV